MDAIGAVVAVAALVAVTAVCGVALRWRAGRVRPEARALGGLAAEHGALGARATLLQFSTEYCAPCRSTRRLLADLAAGRPGTAHVEIDLTDRPELARRLGILQTPTTFLLDGDGRSRARIGGAPRIADLTAELDALIGGPRVRLP